MKDETLITSAVIAAVNASSLAFVWRNHAGAVRVRGGYMSLGPEGSPDVIGFLRDGRFIGIETKTPTGKTAKHRRETQEAFRKRIAGHGAVAGSARSAAEAIALVRAALGGGDHAR
jgi:hypothetical protein